MIGAPMRVPLRDRGGALPTYRRQTADHAPGSGVSAFRARVPLRFAGGQGKGVFLRSLDALPKSG